MLSIKRIDGGVIEIDDAASIVQRFVANDPSWAFDDWASRSPRNHFVDEDLRSLNKSMRARTPIEVWTPFLTGSPPTWLSAISPKWDAATTPTPQWADARIEARIATAFAAMLGHRQRSSVVSKVLHLKRPALIPILDSFVVEQLGGRIPEQASPDDEALLAAQIISHLHGQALGNQPQLTELQRTLGDMGICRTQIRILDILLWASHPRVTTVVPLRRRIDLA